MRHGGTEFLKVFKVNQSKLKWLLKEMRIIYENG